MHLEKMKSSYLKSIHLVLSELVFMLLVGTFWGILGVVAQRPFLGIACGIFLTALFATFAMILENNESIWSGLFAGIVIGVAAVGLSVFVGGSTGSFVAGFRFSLVRGLIFGAIAGAITRVKPGEGDAIYTKIFLMFGSILLGALLGAGVGLFSGVALGLILNNHGSWVVTAVLAGTVGGYLASVKQKPLIIFIVILLSAVGAVAVVYFDGIFSGMMIGLLSGAIAPMALVSLIGAYGGLTSRGPIAMVIEAFEAPQEMLSQGAIPFLVPAMLVGSIIGTTTAGVLSLLALPTILGVLGLFLGATGELERESSRHITSQTFIDKIIIGAEKWPVQKIVSLVFQKRRWKELLTALLLSLITGIGGGYIGIFLINGIIDFIQK